MIPELTDNSPDFMFYCALFFRLKVQRTHSDGWQHCEGIQRSHRLQTRCLVHPRPLLPRRPLRLTARHRCPHSEARRSAEIDRRQVRYHVNLVTPTITTYVIRFSPLNRHLIETKCVLESTKLKSIFFSYASSSNPPRCQGCWHGWIFAQYFPPRNLCRLRAWACGQSNLLGVQVVSPSHALILSDYYLDVEPKI